MTTSWQKRQAYERQKELYMKGASQRDVPMQDITIQFESAKEGDGRDIPLYIRVPKGASKENKAGHVLDYRAGWAQA